MHNQQISPENFKILLKYMENVSEFKNKLNDISKTWDQLILLSQLGSTGIDMSGTKTDFNNLTEELISHLAHATIKKVATEMESKSQVSVDIVIRNLFERTADIGFLATDDSIREFLLKIPDLDAQMESNKSKKDDTKYKIAKKEKKTFQNSIVNRFEEYVAKYSVYYDNGETIASSDKYHIPIGSIQKTEFQSPIGITQFAGRDYIIKTCKTNGYEDFYGLGWLGHIMIPIQSAFNFKETLIDIDQNILKAIMKNQDLFPKALLDIPNKASHIQDQLDRAVWNGNIAQNNDNNADFARSILREVRDTGEKTKTSFNISIEKLNQTIISSLTNR